MKTPFTTEEFFQVFENYNTSLFPSQIVILLFGLIAMFSLHTQKRRKNKLISAFLGLLWLWTGLVYHMTFFTAINKAAYVFGAVFILQGLFFFVEAFSKRRLEFTFDGSARAYLGYLFALFGLIIYPLISYFLADTTANIISLGLPCPTTIFTFGFLMMTTSRFPKYLLVIPTIWALIGTGAAINFGVYQDYVMLVAAVVACIFLVARKRDRF